MADVKQIIAHRVAQELKDGYVVNLGIGLPTLVANYVPEGIDISLQSENGIIGMAGVSAPDHIDPNVVNSGGVNVDIYEGAAFFDSAVSFGIIRGGHVDMIVTELGVLEITDKGFTLRELAPGVSIEDMQAATGAPIVIDGEIKEMCMPPEA